MVLGKITVDDADHPLHPNGRHRVTVNDPRFEIREDADGNLWLALKEGQSLDYEADANRDRQPDGEVLVTVTAVEVNAELNPPAIAALPGRGKYKNTEEKSATFAVVINDKNDAPVAQTVGNWWVTVDDDLEADEVSAGSWLNFQLEIDDGDFNSETGDDFPAFTDQDIGAGDDLTYTLSGSSWLEIEEDSDGTVSITNAKGAIPTRGVYGVTVTATDKAGASASASFELNVACPGWQ